MIYFLSYLGKELYVTCESNAYRFHSDGNLVKVNSVLELESKQEEADTKVFLFSKFVQEMGFTCIRIITVDSDIAILALYYQQQLSVKFFLEYGTGQKTQIFDISSYQPIFKNLPASLPGLHALSGCDSTSAFNGIGKIKCLKVLESDERFIDAVSLLGEEFLLSATIIEILEEYVCELYGVRKVTDMNKARYKLFTNRTKLPEPQKLPPT